MFGLSTDEWRDLVLSVNIHRRNRRLAPVDVARLIRKALVNGSESDIAVALGFTEMTTFRRILRLTSVPDVLAELVTWGRGEDRSSVSMSAASELLRLPEGDLETAFRAAVEYRLSKEESRQIVQVHTRSSLPIQSCVEQALKTRVRFERSELVVGTLLTGKAVEALHAMGGEALARKVKVKLAAKFPLIICQSLKFRDNKLLILFSEADAISLRSELKGIPIEQCITELAETCRNEEPHE